MTIESYIYINFTAYIHIYCTYTIEVYKYMLIHAYTYCTHTHTDILVTSSSCNLSKHCRGALW